MLSDMAPHGGEDESDLERRRAAARAAKGTYQRKERELEAERERLTRLEVEHRTKKEEQARVRRALEKHQLEGVRLESQERLTGRELDALEANIVAQKSHIDRLEGEVETLREEAFRSQR